MGQRLKKGATIPNCGKCGEFRILKKNGVTLYCRSCTRKSQLKYKLADPERRKEQNRQTKAKSRLKTKLRNIRKTYGLPEVEYFALLEKQRFCCAICGVSFAKINSTVDHSHTSGDVRGLLCGKCNAGLGMLKDNLFILEKAVEYLKNHEES